MKRLASACVILLAGCQHLNYQAPEGDNTASVTFTGNNNSAQPVVCVPGKGFKPTEYALAQNPLGGEALNDLLESLKKSQQVTTTVTADTATRIGVSYDQRQTDKSRDRCRVALQFDAVAGQHYQASFLYEDDQCGLSLTDQDGKRVDAVLVDWQCP